MAKSTNLLISKDNKIQDIYTNILSELKDYLVRELASSGYTKFMIGFDLEKPDVTETMRHAIRLYVDDSKLLPMSTFYGDIVSTLTKFAERYEVSSIVRLMLRVYTVENKVGVKIRLRR
ncbi:hypothetical protein RND71_018505 [Anisodus tanguticus]|uniref:Uncharacterized protein n=1 Tax=Anisodus tanguticus TaxID=243964 RepID=A0AAE1VJE9_9SOLA|nr:hypothetical protein RND71_018505 [Anisodus tanguticus]